MSLDSEVVKLAQYLVEKKASSVAPFNPLVMAAMGGFGGMAEGAGLGAGIGLLNNKVRKFANPEAPEVDTSSDAITGALVGAGLGTLTASSLAGLKGMMLNDMLKRTATGVINAI